MKILLAGILGIMAVAGCATNNSAATKTDSKHRLVRIETDPPGMRIYFGTGATTNRARMEREYVGTSPCSYNARSTAKGYFINTVSQFCEPVAVFYAEPPSTATNLIPQLQVFKVPAFVVRPAPIPAAVFFDMHKPR